MKVYRTKEGTAFEVVCGILLFTMWVLVGIFCFGKTHHLNSETKTTILFLAAMGTISTLYCLYSAYRPKEKINMPIEIRTPLQYVHAVRMVRIGAVIISLLFIFIILTYATKSEFSNIGFKVCIFGLLGMVAIYTLIIKKIGKE